ncbi:MAG: AsmA family protein [Pseudohongiellaceae bacterium]
MIKTFARILLGVILLIIVAGTILLLAVNTEQNKAAIQSAVFSSTGYQLTIAGDMDIAFFPSIGLTLNDVRLKNPASPQELASTTAALLQVDLRALLGGEILVRELSTDDFHVNYFINANGVSNWDIQTPASTAGTATTAPSSTQQQVSQSANSPNPHNPPNSPNSPNNSQMVSVSFESLRIANASVDIQDQSQGLRYSVSNLNLVSNNTNIKGRPFDVDVNFNFLNNGMSKPMAMGFSGDVTADMDNGRVNIQNIEFNLTPMLLQGELIISNLREAITFEGSLASNDFDVIGLMETTGVREPELDAASSLLSHAERPQATIDLSFSGNELGIDIPDIVVQLSDSRIVADADISFATNRTPTNIRYEIASNQIDLSAFLSPESTADPIETEGGDGDGDGNVAVASVPDQPAQSTTIAIPSELLNAINVLGSIAIESVVANDLQFTGISIFTNIEDGVLDVEIQPVSVFEGSIAGNVRLDARSEQATLATQVSIRQMNLADLAPTISRLNSVTGKLDVEIDLTASGQTTDAMTESLNGSATFAINENSVDIGVIKQVFTAVSALSPNGGTIEQWPDVIRFAELGGFILINDGIEGNQQLNLRMDNFDVSGTGGINLSEKNFDYDLLFTILGEPYLQTIQVAELYHDVSWPVECTANFADEVNQYCRPDFSQVREIFTQLGSDALRNQLNEVISDQLPPEIRDDARGLLRNLLN